MRKPDEKYEAVIDAVYENGETIDLFGEYDEEAEEGHDVELIEHEKNWLVVENNGNKENVSLFDDEAEAREIFAEVKAEIEKEEVEE